MSPFILFLYLLAVAGGVLVIGLAWRVLRVVDLTLQAALVSERKSKEARPRRVWFWTRVALWFKRAITRVPA